MTTLAPTSAAELFSPHTGHRLSIVVQGGVNASNIAQTANYCQHWRDLFPHAEIIMAISSPDTIGGTRSDGNPEGLMLNRNDGGLAEAALGVIKGACDKVVQAEGALPLPPIKTDSPGLNNVNLQIAAAQAGLALATGTHILRIRNDLIFADTDFVTQWLNGNKLARGTCAALRQRVLISYLYTLNPYTYERMPFHYSDWFHFGLAPDVADLWNVPFMTMAQAIHYRHHSCADYSNYQERRMLTRLAVEQHIAYFALRHYFPDLTLNYHNDLTDVRRSIDILCDNFIVCDLLAAKSVFDKYANDFENPLKRLHCIPPEDGRMLATLPPAAREPALLERARIADNPALAPFPRHYRATALSTQTGEHAHGVLMTMSRAGLLAHGPYDTLPRGSFTALVDLRRFDGKGLLDLRVTLGGGTEVLARRSVALCDVHDQTIAIDFDIHHDTGRLFEVVVEAPGVPLIALGGVTVERRQPGEANTVGVQLSAADHPFQSQVGTSAQGMLHTSGTGGRLLFGPYLALARGSYTLRITMPQGNAVGHSYIEILAGDRHRRIACRGIKVSDLATRTIELPFLLSNDEDQVEFRITVNQGANFTLDDVQLSGKLTDGPPPGVARQALSSYIHHTFHTLRGLIEVK
ncbi:WavE lipopolysaccharide synthesis family protein [Novosphingobium terrae]|uniref:WavE lipopolysaccharide synthesis family protein n=1 Tax=Novosphingobium terrae TaxID=2726189 RepID=UPI00197EB7B8|nr:WavE lipopolysaccharide synthesis family protein [Novosphingobium terrae]